MFFFFFYKHAMIIPNFRVYVYIFIYTRKIPRFPSHIFKNFPYNAKRACFLHYYSVSHINHAKKSQNSQSEIAISDAISLFLDRNLLVPKRTIMIIS